MEVSSLRQETRTRPNKKNDSENNSKRKSKKTKPQLGLKSLPNTSKFFKNPSEKYYTKPLWTTQSESLNSVGKSTSRICSTRTRGKNLN